MPFVKGKPRRFWLPVKVVEIADGGETEAFGFEAQFSPPTREELEQSTAGELADSEILRRHVHDWRGVEDVEGNAVEFSDAELADLMEDLAAWRGLWATMRDVITGEAARKN